MNTTRSLTLFLALALLGFVSLALTTPTARAADPVIVRVTTSGTATWPCGDATNWSNACALQTALTRSIAGTELWVAAGTYTPTTGADRNATFQLRDGVALYGGFAMTETQRSQRDLTANATILSGDIGIPGDSNDNAYSVVTAGSGVTNTAVLDGFTVTGGNSSGPGSYYEGGGLLNNGASLTLSNIIFTNNWAYYDGGGMYNSNSSPTLINVTFIGNTAQFGGGMYNLDSSVVLTNVTFFSNTVTYSNGSGGGMYNRTSSPVLTNVTFSSNSAYIGGGMENYLSNPTLNNVAFISNTATGAYGGMASGGGSATLTNVTFSGNSAPYGGGLGNETKAMTLTNVTFSGNTATYTGGGMQNREGNATLTNVTFSGNSAGQDGGGMYNRTSSGGTGSHPTIRNAIFWDNTAPSGSQIGNDATSTANLSDSVVKDGCPGSSTTCTRILTADPHLGALGNYGGATQTIRLLPGSSAIDAGNNAICPSTDQRGKPRVGTCDSGAFEFQGYSVSKPSGDQQSTRVNTLFANPLQVSLTEIESGLLVPGITLTFNAPSSGASAAWSGSLVVTATTNASGVATVAPPTANDIAGSYAVTATTAGANPPATFSLMNLAFDSYLPLIRR